MGPEVPMLCGWSPNSTLAEFPACWRRGVTDRIGAVGMEVCEVLVGLHGEGLVLGCLRLDCFCLDRSGHCLLDLNEVLSLCRRIRAGVCLPKAGTLVATEMPAVLSDATPMKVRDFDGSVRHNSDAWLVGCILVALVTRDEQLAAGWNTDGPSYDDWKKEVLTRLDAALAGTQLEPLAAITASCLSYDPEGRPEIADVWKCIRGLLMKSDDALAPDDDVAAQKSFRYLLLGVLSSMCSDPVAVESDNKMQPSEEIMVARTMRKFVQQELMSHSVTGCSACSP